MKNITIENFIRERIYNNKDLFTKQEICIMNNNINIIKKVYILGVKDGKEI